MGAARAYMHARAYASMCVPVWCALTGVVPAAALAAPMCRPACPLGAGLPQVVVANPKTAGVARWIFLALWGHKMKAGDAAALDYITKARGPGRGGAGARDMTADGLLCCLH